MRATFAIAIFSVLVLLSYSAIAEELTCENEYGTCTMSENSYECQCAGGGDSGVAIGGGTIGEGSSSSNMEVSEEACLDMLTDMCESSVPIDTCESEKGACTIYKDYHSCECADGSAGEGSESSEPGYPGDEEEVEDIKPTDPEEDDVAPPVEKKVLNDEDLVCDELLLGECPNDPPDPAAECSTEELSICNDFKNFAKDCYGEEFWPYQTIQCCEDYRDNKDEVGKLHTCMKSNTCDTFYDNCYEDIEEAGDLGSWAEDELQEGADGAGSNNDKGNGEENEDDEDDNEDDATTTDADSDCSQAGSAVPFFFMLMLLTAAILRRSRSSIK